MIRQVPKFYLTSFLKNQTYFTPILVLFLQFHHLNYQQIFWVFTIGSVYSFLIEIPTGVIADLWGKRSSIILSKLIIFLSYLAFGFSDSFFLFVFSQILLETGNAFRSGTEAAYTYDYLQEQKDSPGVPSYTEVKGKQKFYARIGEAAAAALGGFLAAQWGYNAVFFAAALPAFCNFLLALSWEPLNSDTAARQAAKKSSFTHVRESLFELQMNSGLRRTVINIALFTSVLAALNKFIQPYMLDAAVPVDLFGLIYSASLIVTALAVRYSYLLQKRWGGQRTVNVLSAAAVLPVLIIGFGYISIAGVILFFLVVIIENIRSPIANNQFHVMVASHRRATLGSMLAQSKAVVKIILLPLAGFWADLFSLYTAVLILGLFLGINAIFLRFKPSDANIADQ